MAIDLTTSTEERQGALRQGRLTVPWKTVALLAVVLAYADGFWLTSLRGAVGAIERTQAPFASWWRESTVVLPVYVFAVLGVLTLAVRWFGPVLHRPRTVAVTALLIVAAATVVGLAATVASSAYDFHLQSAQQQLMHAMGSGHGSLAHEQQATLAVHVHAVIYISRWLLLTNLVLVAWMVALCGGRLKVATTKLQPDGMTDNRRPSGSRVNDLRLLLVGALLASAAIHAALVPGHLTDWAGAFYIFLAVWELVVAGMLLARLEERMMMLAAAVISIVPLVLALYSHTIGLPDLMACAVELVSLGAAVVLLRAPGWLGRRAPASTHLRSLVLVALVAVIAIGVAGTGLSWFDAFGISGHQPVVMDMEMPS